MENEKAPVAQTEDNGVGTQHAGWFSQWLADLKPKPSHAGNDIAASLAALRSVTWMHWAMFFSGCAVYFHVDLDGADLLMYAASWPGRSTPSTSSAFPCRSRR
jgi:hypothetical protein